MLLLRRRGITRWRWATECRTVCLSPHYILWFSSDWSKKGGRAYRVTTELVQFVILAMKHL